MDQHLLKHPELAQPTEPETPVTGQPVPEPFMQNQHPSCAMGTVNPPSLQVFRTYKTKKLMNYNSCQSRRLGILQLVFGSIGLGLNLAGIVLAAVGKKYRNRWNNAYWDNGYKDNNANMDLFYDGADGTPYYISSGLWGGLFFALSGSLALVAAKKKTKCVITSNMIFSIFASACALAMLGMAIWALVSDADRVARGFHYEIHPRNNQYNRYKRQASFDQDGWDYSYEDPSYDDETTESPTTGNVTSQATYEDRWWLNDESTTISESPTAAPAHLNTTRYYDYWWWNKPDTTTTPHWWWNRLTTTTVRPSTSRPAWPWWDRSSPKTTTMPPTTTEQPRWETTTAQFYNDMLADGPDYYDDYYYNNHRTTMPPMPTNTESPIEVYAGHYAVLKLVSLVISGVFVLVSIIQVIVSVRNAYICGRVLCCSVSESSEAQHEEVRSFVNGGYVEHNAEQGQTVKSGLLTGQSSSIAGLSGQGHCGFACFWNPNLCSDICNNCKCQEDNSTQWMVMDQNGQPVPGATVIRIPHGYQGPTNGVQIGQTGGVSPGMIQSA